MKNHWKHCRIRSGSSPKSNSDLHFTKIRLIERRQEFWQGLLAAYVDLCKAFDKVNRDALWRILGLCGVSPKLINLMSERYSGTKSVVRCGGAISDLFPLVTGVRQGCELAPTLFSTCMDWILGRMSEIKLRCIVWEYQDLWLWFRRWCNHLCGDSRV